MKDPYVVLGMDKDSDAALLKARYEELKAQYGEERFMTGEAGNEGARKLSELEEAWFTINQDINKTEAKETFGGDYGQIDDLVKNGKFDEAQSMLDSIIDRDAEWHYLQSIIFYKREWMSECLKQLEMAVAKEPRNEKYKQALEKLNMVMGNPNANAQRFGYNPTGGQNMNGQDVPPQQQNMMGGNCLSNCCCAYCLTDCCCNAMQCCS